MASARGKVVVSAEVPTAMRAEIDKRAKVEGRLRAEVIGRAIRFYLAHAPVIRSDAVPEPKG